MGWHNLSALIPVSEETMAAKSGKKMAQVWYSKGHPEGTRVAKGQTYREMSVACPSGKRQRRGF